MEQVKLSRRSFLAGTAATGALAALALSGCGSGDKQVAENEGEAADTADAGIITAALANTSTNVNPVGCNGGSALMLAATWHVFEGLYEVDLHDYSVYNGLAAGDPVKVDDTTWTVALREGALYSDGSEVTASDVVNAFNLNLADSTCGPFIDFVDTVEATDATTVQFNLKYPFDNLLKTRFALVKVFPESLTEEQLTTMPIGSGPWKYESVDGNPGGQLIFTPNEHYNGTMPATASRMEWSVLVDNDARTTAIVDGTVLAIANVPDANAELIENAGATVDYIPGFNQPFLMFNTRKAPFNDVRVRQAFFYAIDVEKMIANALNGHAAPLTGFMPNYEPFTSAYHKASTVYTYDPQKAQDLLAEAGAQGLSFTLWTNTTMAAIAPTIIEDLTAVGLNVTNRQEAITWAELNPPSDPSTILPFDVMLTGGDPTCFSIDPDLLMTWWYGDNLWTKGRSCWADTPEWAELQTLLQQAREESDASKQQDLWNQCYDIIAENVPLYGLCHQQQATGYYADMLENYTPIGTTGLVFLGTTPVA